MTMQLIALIETHDYRADPRPVFHCDGCHRLTRHDKNDGRYVCAECGYKAGERKENKIIANL